MEGCRRSTLHALHRELPSLRSHRKPGSPPVCRRDEKRWHVRAGKPPLLPAKNKLQNPVPSSGPKMRPSKHHVYHANHHNFTTIYHPQTPKFRKNPRKNTTPPRRIFSLLNPKKSPTPPSKKPANSAANGPCSAPSPSPRRCSYPQPQPRQTHSAPPASSPQDHPKHSKE
jgi:hypothetical protein